MLKVYCHDFVSFMTVDTMLGVYNIIFFYYPCWTMTDVKSQTSTCTNSIDNNFKK